jgi:hypothetical protein
MDRFMTTPALTVGDALKHGLPDEAKAALDVEVEVALAQLTHLLDPVSGKGLGPDACIQIITACFCLQMSTIIETQFNEDARADAYQLVLKVTSATMRMFSKAKDVDDASTPGKQTLNS